MESHEYIRLAENRDVRSFLSEKREALLAEMLNREPDGSPEFSQWAAAKVMRLQMLWEIEADIDESGESARKRVSKENSQ